MILVLWSLFYDPYYNPLQGIQVKTEGWEEDSPAMSYTEGPKFNPGVVQIVQDYLTSEKVSRFVIDDTNKG